MSLIVIVIINYTTLYQRSVTDFSTSLQHISDKIRKGTSCWFGSVDTKSVQHSSLDQQTVKCNMYISPDLQDTEYMSCSPSKAANVTLGQTLTVPRLHLAKRICFISPDFKRNLSSCCGCFPAEWLTITFVRIIQSGSFRGT